MARAVYLLYVEESTLKQEVRESEARQLLAKGEAYECEMCSGPGTIALHPITESDRS